MFGPYVGLKYLALSSMIKPPKIDNFICKHLNPLCANHNKSRLVFSSAEMFKKPLWQKVWTQIRLGAVCSGSTLFASLLNSSVMLGNYLQQTTSTDDMFICIFFFKG